MIASTSAGQGNPVGRFGKRYAQEREPERMAQGLWSAVLAARETAGGSEAGVGGPKSVSCPDHHGAGAARGWRGLAAGCDADWQPPGSGLLGKVAGG